MKLKDINKEDKILLPRALTGLDCLLKIIFRKKGSQIVAVSNNCCLEVALSIISNNHKIHLMDISQKTLNPISQDFKKAYELGSRIFIVTNTYGISGWNDYLDNLKNNDVLVIDDAAQAFPGERNKNSLIGLKGDFGLFSFGSTKQMQAEGGLITLNNQKFKSLFKLCESNLKNYDLPENKAYLENIRNYQYEFIKNNNFYRNKILCKNLVKDLIPSLSPIKKNNFNTKLFNSLLSKTDGIKNKHLENSNIYKKYFANNPRVAIFESTLDNCLWRFPIYLKFNKNIVNEIRINIRKRNIDVSNWYIPLNQLLGLESDGLGQSIDFFENSLQLWLNYSTELTKSNSIKILSILNSF